MEQLFKLAEMFYRKASEKRFWGVKGSGALFICREDKTILLAKRSGNVEQGGTWGIPGGAVDIYENELVDICQELVGHPGFWYFPNRDKNKYPDPPDNKFRESALREVEEECGTIPHIESEDQIITFKDKQFTYKTFVFNISLQAKNKFNKLAQTNWETSEFSWFPIDKPPRNLHPGLEFALNKLKI